MYRLRMLLLFILFAVGAVSGCGNKGPLYLPDGREAPADLPESDLPARR